MRNEWFKPLLNELADSYSARIIINDDCRCSLRPEVIAALKRRFAVHIYSSELELRTFLRRNSGSRTLIIKLPEVSYLPFDIEQSSQIIDWKKADCLPDPAGIRKKGEKPGVREEFISGLSSSAGRLEQLLNEGPVPWGKIGYLWGKISFLKDRLFYSAVYGDDFSVPRVERLVKALEGKLEEKFTDFMLNHYGTLFYQSFIKSLNVMLFH